jgi:hypothetical protein
VRIEKHDVERLNRAFLFQAPKYFTNSSKCPALTFSRPGIDRFQPNKMTLDPIATSTQEDVWLTSYRRTARFDHISEIRRGRAVTGTQWRHSPGVPHPSSTLSSTRS